MDFRQFEDLITQAELVQNTAGQKQIIEETTKISQPAPVQQFIIKPKMQSNKYSQYESSNKQASTSTEPLNFTQINSTQTDSIEQPILPILPNLPELTQTSIQASIETQNKFQQTTESQPQITPQTSKCLHCSDYKLKLKQAKKFNDQILEKLEEKERDNENLASQLQNLNKRWEKLVDNLTSEQKQNQEQILQFQELVQSENQRKIACEEENAQYEIVIKQLNLQLDELKTLLTFQSAKIDDLNKDKAYFQSLNSEKTVVFLEKGINSDQVYHLESQVQTESQRYEILTQTENFVVSEDKSIDNGVEQKVKKTQTKAIIKGDEQCEQCCQVSIVCEKCQALDNKYSSEHQQNKMNLDKIDDLEQEIVELQDLINQIQEENDKSKKKQRITDKENLQMKDQIEQFEELMMQVKEQIETLKIELDEKDDTIGELQSKIMAQELKIEQVCGERNEAIENFEKIRLMFK